MHSVRRRASFHRIQAVTALCWSCLCVVLLVKHDGSLSQKHLQLLWTYFQPVAPPLLMLGLWAQAVAHFEQQHISFEACFPDSERRWLAPSKDIFSLFTVYVCAAIGALTLCVRICTTSSGTAPLLVPPVLYICMLLILVMPVNALRRPSRLYFVNTIGKVLVPVQPVGWADFLLADMLTSLAKSSSDMLRSVCLTLHGPLVHPSHSASATAAAACGPLTVASLAALVLPYLIRLVQCIMVWRAGGPRSQLFNALKYASSLPALILTAVEHEYHVHKRPFHLKALWIIVMVLNSSYSFYWDVEQDWDMPWIVQYGGKKVGPVQLPALKGTHMYSSSWYAWLLVSNLVLRFTWAHRLLGDLEAHNEVLMVVALLEVLRRWQWVFVRVETELRKLGLLAPQEDGDHEYGLHGYGRKGHAYAAASAHELTTLLVKV